MADRRASNLLVEALLPFGLLCALLFLPPLGFYLAGTESHSAGLTVAFVIIIGALGLRVRPRIPWFAFGMILAVIVAHGIVAALFRPMDLQRATLSLGVLALGLITAAYLSRWLFSLNEQVIRSVLELLRVLMVGFALISFTGFQPATSSYFDKPVFPFSEPSHFALIFLPLIAHACVTSVGFRRYTWLAICAVLALVLQNLSMVVGTVLIACVCLPLWQIVIAGAVAFSTLELIDLRYYTDRLDFSNETTNQSALVYLQGWELAQDSWMRMKGWGIGFQQLGTGEFASPSADALFRIYNLESNLFDGSFFAAKLIAEFGIFGIAIVTIYAVFAVRTAWALRLHSVGKRPLDRQLLLPYAICVSYLIDIFVRGLSFFSASSVLCAASLIYLLDRRKSRIERHR